MKGEEEQGKLEGGREGEREGEGGGGEGIEVRIVHSLFELTARQHSMVDDV